MTDGECRIINAKFRILNQKFRIQNQKYASKRGGGNSVGGSGLYPPLLFDCTTERLFDCSKIEPTVGVTSSTTARWLRHP